MVTAADLSTAQMNMKPDHAPAAQTATAVATAEPVAVYRPAATLSLSQWLASQPADDRQRLTILVRHDGKDPAGAIASALKLEQEAEQVGRSPRLIVEQGASPDLMAFLAYDSDPDAMARNLRGQDQQTNREENR